ncbi:MAG: nuclear transport factor 2 family protein [Leadbetterella sp.]
MYKYILSTIIALCSLQSFAQEDQAIIATLNNYLDGGTNGDVAQFTSAFFPDAVQRAIGSTGSPTGMTVKDLAGKIKPGQKMERTTKIISWSYAGTAATAITETEYATNKIIDMLNLLKLGNDWKIISRVYSRIQKEEAVISSNPTPVATGKAGSATKPAATKPKPKANDGW